MPTTIVALTFVAWWYFTRQPDSLKKFYWPSLILKIGAGMLVGIVYFNYYGIGDTIGYWQDGNLLAEEIISDPVSGINFFLGDTPSAVKGLVNDRPRSIFFVKIVAILSIICGGNYWVMDAVISFISFLGAWYIFRKTTSFFPESTCASSIAFLFFPSVIFWSSGLIKESMGLTAVFFLSGFFLMIITNQKVHWWEWIVALISVWVGWNLKYYWIGIFIPVAISTVIVAKLKIKFDLLRKFEIITWIGVFVLVLSIGTSVHPNFYPSRFLEVLVQNNEDLNSHSKPGNLVHYDSLAPTVVSILTNAPQALIAGLFRPFIWEQHNILSLLAAVENFIFMLLLFTALPRMLHILKSPYRLITISVITYTIILAVFLALSSPNFGTLSRYKIGFLPLIVFVLIYRNPVIYWWNSRNLLDR